MFTLNASQGPELDRRTELERRTERWFFWLFFVSFEVREEEKRSLRLC